MDPNARTNKQFQQEINEIDTANIDTKSSDKDLNASGSRHFIALRDTVTIDYHCPSDKSSPVILELSFEFTLYSIYVSRFRKQLPAM